MKKWALIIDVARCINCQNCVLATEDEHSDPTAGDGGGEVGARWIKIERCTRGNDSMLDVTYVPQTCNHCEEAPCVAASGGAIYRRVDGIVVIDAEKSHGRRDLLQTCPYGAISWNEERRLPQKWSFDAHLLDSGWSEPRCSQACPTGALRALRLDESELAEIQLQQGLEEIRPELRTRSRVLYRNLHRATRCFLGGTVTRRLADDTLENVARARVELFVSGQTLRSCATDEFGDFKFDDLCGGTAWSLRVSHPQHGHTAADGVLAESRYLGTLLLGAELVSS